MILPNYGTAVGAERLASVAVAAERSGFDSGWVTDHLVVQAEHASNYGTTAEALVSLDFLSGECILTAVTPGWMEAEYDSLGVDYEGRGRRLYEWLEMAASVWEQMPGHVRYAKGELRVDGWMDPAPTGPGGPELWAAGVSRATLRRAEVTGIWHPVALPPDERVMAALLRARRPDSRVILRIGVYVAPSAAYAKDERGRHAVAGPSEWVASRLSEYVDAGCDGFVLNLDHQSPGLEERVRHFAEEIAPLLAA